MQNFDLTWAQRDHIATKLYKGDWRGAVALVPDEQKPILQELCDTRSLAELDRPSEATSA